MVRTSKIPQTIAALEAFKVNILREAASFLEEKMKNTILKQTESSWPPLSPITLRMKAPERRKLYESGALVGDIKSRIHNTYATIGIHPDAPNHDKGMYNEYGTQHIPARSFVRSTWSKYHKTVIDMVTVTFVKRIKKIGR